MAFTGSRYIIYSLHSFTIWRLPHPPFRCASTLPPPPPPANNNKLQQSQARRATDETTKPKENTEKKEKMSIETHESRMLFCHFHFRKAITCLCSICSFKPAPPGECRNPDSEWLFGRRFYLLHIVLISHAFRFKRQTLKPYLNAMSGFGMDVLLCITPYTFGIKLFVFAFVERFA